MRPGRRRACPAVTVPEGRALSHLCSRRSATPPTSWPSRRAKRMRRCSLSRSSAGDSAPSSARKSDEPMIVPGAAALPRACSRAAGRRPGRAAVDEVGGDAGDLVLEVRCGEGRAAAEVHLVLEGGHAVAEAAVDARLARVEAEMASPASRVRARWSVIIAVSTPRRRASGCTPTHVRPANGTRSPPGSDSSIGRTP